MPTPPIPIPFLSHPVPPSWRKVRLPKRRSLLVAGPIHHRTALLLLLQTQIVHEPAPILIDVHVADVLPQEAAGDRPIRGHGVIRAARTHDARARRAGRGRRLHGRGIERRRRHVEAVVGDEGVVVGGGRGGCGRRREAEGVGVERGRGGRGAGRARGRFRRR